jgi:hypothetical protein
MEVLLLLRTELEVNWLAKQGLLAPLARTDEDYGDGVPPPARNSRRLRLRFLPPIEEGQESEEDEELALATEGAMDALPVGSELQALYADGEWYNAKVLQLRKEFPEVLISFDGSEDLGHFWLGVHMLRATPWSGGLTRRSSGP